MLLWTVAVAAEDDRQRESASPDAGHGTTKQLSTETLEGISDPVSASTRKITAGYSNTVVTKENNTVSL